MYDGGQDVATIARVVGVSRASVYPALSHSFPPQEGLAQGPPSGRLRPARVRGAARTHSVTVMTAYSTAVRATHLLTNAAWFGGSLMGAVALNPAAQQGNSRRERAQISDTAWTRWGPIQGGAIALHLLSGLAIVADNRHRALVHPPTRAAVVAKTALTASAVAATGAAYLNGARLGMALQKGPSDTRTNGEAAELSQRLRWLQWATPAATAAMLVLDAYLGEQQRGRAGLLDRASNRPGF